MQNSLVFFRINLVWFHFDNLTTNNKFYLLTASMSFHQTKVMAMYWDFDFLKKKLLFILSHSGTKRNQSLPWEIKNCTWNLHRLQTFCTLLGSLNNVERADWVNRLIKEVFLSWSNVNDKMSNIFLYLKKRSWLAIALHPSPPLWEVHVFLPKYTPIPSY